MKRSSKKTAATEGMNRSTTNDTSSKDDHRAGKGSKSKRTSKDNDGNDAEKSVNTSSDGSQRAKWTEVQEFDLLERYLDTRSKPEHKTDKGLKSKSRNALVERLNKQHVRTLDKEQYKSNLARLLHTYDLYKHVTGLSGGGVDADIPTLDDDVWDELINSKPAADRDIIKKIRKSGFVHATVCSLIAGDTRARGEEAPTIDELLEEIDGVKTQSKTANVSNTDLAR